MPPCCQLPAVPPWLLPLLTPLLVKCAFRRGSVRSGGWSLLRRQAFEKGEVNVPPWGQVPADDGDTPSPSKGWSHNSVIPAAIFQFSKWSPLLQGATYHHQHQHSAVSSSATHHTFSALAVSHTCAPCRQARRGRRAANSKSRKQWWTTSIGGTYFSTRSSIWLR